MSRERTAPPSFHGAHQPGIATRQQDHLAFAAFDVTVQRAAELRGLLAALSAAAERLMAGRRSATDVEAGIDSGETNELAPARLTITFGLGPSLFERDRLGFADRRPTALRPLPAFAGDALEPDRCGGDLCVQACSDGVQVAFHALRIMARVAAGAAVPRWAQTQFVPIQRRLVDEDGLSRFAVHTASAVFAIPPGARKGGFVGDGMFGETA
jgi:deferrochelatase/peroxidase EfeB